MGALDTAARHWQVARAAWAEQRQAEKSGSRRENARANELAFLPAALEVTETPAAPLGRAIMLAICLFFAIAIAWASIGEMDIIATAQGKIIPSERVKVIQPLESGIVRAIHVRDGQGVAAGDVLVELDPTGSEADRARLAEELVTAEIEAARLSALLTKAPVTAFSPPDGAPAALVQLHRAYLESELSQHQAERAALEGEIQRRRAELSTIAAGVHRLEKKLSKVRERVEGRRKLYAKGLVPKLTFAEEEEQLFDAEGQLDVEKKRLFETRASLTSARAQRAQMEAEWRRSIHERRADASNRAQAARQELIKASERNRQQTLTAPVAGTVQQLDVHTIGGVVTPAQPLMQIVPAGAELEVEALVLNKDIGFVHKGQEAELKVESFPFTKYGTIAGNVRHVYADAVENEQTGLAYPARIAMAKTTMLVKDRQVNLTPGMAITVEIKTGKRKIIDYILAPLQEYQDESLREQ